MIDRALNLLSDERLAQLTAGGSDAAFTALYGRYSGPLFAYCRSITRNADDGWDALQNAMVKVLVALRRSPDRTAPVRPWLFCIAHNEAVGILRRRAASDRVADAVRPTVVGAGADEQAEIREHIGEVVNDVQQLPTGQRAALVMRELADLRYDEIATALETTEVNARQLVFAARAGLRDSRAGRGLPCESVRDQLTLADGRLLRRRSVRAHLRTCEGCRSYAGSLGRRPVRALGAWSPVAAYRLLEPIMRAAGEAGTPSVVPSFFARAATLGVVVVVGIGVAEPARRAPSAPVAGNGKAAMKRGSKAVVSPVAPVRRATVAVAVDTRAAASDSRRTVAAVVHETGPRAERKTAPAAEEPVAREQDEPEEGAPEPREPARSSGAGRDCDRPHEAAARYEPRPPQRQPDQREQPVAYQQQQEPQPTRDDQFATSRAPRGGDAPTRDGFAR